MAREVEAKKLALEEELRRTEAQIYELEGEYLQVQPQIPYDVLYHSVSCFTHFHPVSYCRRRSKMAIS